MHPHSKWAHRDLVKMSSKLQSRTLPTSSTLESGRRTPGEKLRKASIQLNSAVLTIHT